MSFVEVVVHFSEVQRYKEGHVAIYLYDILALRMIQLRKR